SETTGTNTRGIIGNLQRSGSTRRVSWQAGARPEHRSGHGARNGLEDSDPATTPPMFAAGRRVHPAAATPKEAGVSHVRRRSRAGGCADGRLGGLRMQETPGIRTSPGCRGFPPLARDAPLGFGLTSVDAAGLTSP